MSDIKKIKEEFLLKLNKNLDLKRPSHWGGVELVIREIEFWQGRENRLHNRVISSLSAGSWKHNILSP